MLRHGELEILDTLDELVDPKHTAVVLWDFARALVANSFNSATLLASTVRLVARVVL